MHKEKGRTLRTIQIFTTLKMRFDGGVSFPFLLSWVMLKVEKVEKMTLHRLFDQMVMFCLNV